MCHIIYRCFFEKFNRHLLSISSKDSIQNTRKKITTISSEIFALLFPETHAGIIPNIPPHILPVGYLEIHSGFPPDAVLRIFPEISPVFPLTIYPSISSRLLQKFFRNIECLQEFF